MGRHPELDVVRELVAFEDDTGQPVVVQVDRPLHPANQRLMDSLGVEGALVNRRGRTLLERFEDMYVVDPFSGCWIWIGDVCATYGRIREGGGSPRSLRAHRIAYELFIGPIPEGLQIDHLCRNRLCVNPTHLEPVTSRENTLRGTSPAAINATKTHCDRGHSLANAGVRNGERYCRECRRIDQRERRRLGREAA